MGIDRHWIASFNNSEILFASNTENIYVGARSMVEGMGLSWGTQYLKIKKRFNYFHMKTVGRDSRLRDTLGLHKNFIQGYLGAININRVSSENSELVKLYKEEFSCFVDKQTSMEEKRDVDFYLDPDNGIKCLIEDAFKLQNKGVIKHFANLFRYIQSNPESIGDHYIFPDTILDIAEILAVNQHKL